MLALARLPSLGWRWGCSRCETGGRRVEDFVKLYGNVANDLLPDLLT
ncbi:MAG TPA: hypothetical protein VFZ65_04550 [Planctomycetota bacterium]|nr:hypothetical protein [Planctomycetota bacterium]